MTSSTSPTVIVVGGGYGGATVATALDMFANVTLVEPQEAFVHNVGTLRAIAEPAWIDRLFLPYDKLLSRGRIVQGRAKDVRPGAVVLEDGTSLMADYVVVAAGSSTPFPGKVDDDDVEGAKASLRRTHADLARAEHALILGAGPIGLELAGEIKAAWPEKSVTIVDPQPVLLSGRFPDAVRQAVHEQLDAMGVEVLLGAALPEPAIAPATFGEFEATTDSGVQLRADIWFRAFGTQPNLLPVEGARLDGGRLAVSAQLGVEGADTVYAIGDVTAVPEMKMARLAQMHAEVVAANIRSRIEGREETASYEAAADAIVLPLGPRGGVSYDRDVGVLDAATTAHIKGDLYLGTYEELLGLRQAAA